MGPAGHPEAKIGGVNCNPDKVVLIIVLDLFDYLFDTFSENDGVWCGAINLTPLSQNSLCSDPRVFILKGILNWDSAETAAFVVPWVFV